MNTGFPYRNILVLQRTTGWQVEGKYWVNGWVWGNRGPMSLCFGEGGEGSGKWLKMWWNSILAGVTLGWVCSLCTMTPTMPTTRESNSSYIAGKKWSSSADWWLSSLEHCPVHQKFAVSIPGQGTYLGWGFNPWSGRMREPTDWCFSRRCFSFFFSNSWTYLQVRIKNNKNKIKLGSWTVLETVYDQSL